MILQAWFNRLKQVNTMERIERINAFISINKDGYFSAKMEKYYTKMGQTI